MAIPSNAMAWIEVNNVNLDYIKHCGKVPTWGGRHVPHLEYIKRGAMGFQRAGLKQAVISTSTLTQARLLYPQMREILPGIQIIGGLKAWGFFSASDIESVDNWKALEDAAAEVAALTGSPIVVVDWEYTIGPWFRNEIEYDIPKIKEVINEIHLGDFVYAHYDITVAHVHRLPSQLKQMVQAFDLGKTIFMTGLVCGRPTDVDSIHNAPYLRMMEEAVPRDRTWHFYYMMGSTNSWAVMPACYHANRNPDINMLMYPGLCEWGARGSEAAREYPDG